MKTMRRGDKIVRVKENEQYSFLERGYEYCPKHVWIKNVRDIKKKKGEIKEKIQENIQENPEKTKRGKNS